VTVALIYHDIAGAGAPDQYGFPGPAAARYKLEPERFEAHLDAISRVGVSVGPLRTGPQVTLTFDDGGASALHAAAALEQRGWRGSFFITTGRVGSPGFLTRSEVHELAARGHEVGSHSHTHPTYMGALDREQLALEWRVSRAELAEILGRPPDSAAVPGGFVSEAVIEEAARAGYRLLMTSNPAVRPSRHDGMLVHGRCTIWSTTAPGRAAAYARGDRVALTALWLAWQAKSTPKRISPRGYELVRQRWARVRQHPSRSR
jgi:peptidoglycan/xylan/chitin deacetylase (PgdA/CDA1 family)